MRKSFVSFLVLLSLVLSCQLTFAETPKTRKTSAGIAYMTGGIGEEEFAVMKSQSKNFTLNLLFSEGTVGRWATNVNVNIYDEASQLVFRVVGSQPALHVNLPAGTYTILANNNGNKLRHKLTLVESENQKVILNWKDFVDEDVPLDGEGN
jgi:hypothetical protein